MREGKLGMELEPIGSIHTKFKNIQEAPFQGRWSKETSVIEIFPEHVPGLKDIEYASYLIVLYWCHLATRDTLQTKTPHGPEIRGVFACRSPHRPNPIAFCVAKLLGQEENRLLVKGLDALDGSPLLDIKPYSSDLDSITGAHIGWLKANNPEF